MNLCANTYRAGFSCCISSLTSRSASSQSWTSCPTSPPLRSNSSYAFRATRALNSGLAPPAPLLLVLLDPPLERSILDVPFSREDCQPSGLDGSCMVDRLVAIVAPLPHYIVGAIVALPYLWYSPPLELLAGPPPFERADVYSFMLTYELARERSCAGLTVIDDSCRL